MSKRKSPDLTVPRWSFCKYLIWSVVKWTYNFEEGWSLDVCVGRTLESGKFRWDQIVCPKTLCNYVDNGLIRTKNIELAGKLKRSTKKKIVRKNKRILGDSAGCKGIIWYFVLLATARWHFKVPSGGCYLPGKKTCNSESLCYNHDILEREKDPLLGGGSVWPIPLPHIGVGLGDYGQRKKPPLRQVARKLGVNNLSQTWSTYILKKRNLKWFWMWYPSWIGREIRRFGWPILGPHFWPIRWPIRG